MQYTTEGKESLLMAVDEDAPMLVKNRLPGLAEIEDEVQHRRAIQIRRSPYLPILFFCEGCCRLIF